MNATSVLISISDTINAWARSQGANGAQLPEEALAIVMQHIAAYEADGCFGCERCSNGSTIALMVVANAGASRITRSICVCDEHDTVAVQALLGVLNSRPGKSAPPLSGTT